MARNYSKHLIYNIVFAFAVLVTACVKVSGPETPAEQQSPESNDRGMEIVLTGSAGTAATKTALTTNNAVIFKEGDALSVFPDAYDIGWSNCRFEMSGTPKDDGSADFKGEVPYTAESFYYAVYPYDASFSASMQKVAGQYVAAKFKFDVPSVQKGTSDSFDPSAAISIARIENTDIPFEMKNVCALLKFTTGGEYSKIVISARGGEDLTGNLHLTFRNAEDECSIDQISEENSSMVTITGPLQSGERYYAAVIPGELASGLEVLFYDSKGRLEGHKVTKNEVTLKKNVILNMGTIAPDKTGSWAGDGTKDNPYLISSYEQLKMLATEKSSFSDIYFRQTEDIDCGGDVFIKDFFSGHYDGDGHMVKNYIPGWMSSSPEEYLYSGLFGTVSGGGSIKNLTVKPKDVSEISDETGFFEDLRFWWGAIVGRLQGSTIENCRLAEGDYRISLKGGHSWLSSTYIYAGGLVGELYWSGIYNCTNDGNLKINPSESSSSLNFTGLFLGGMAGEINHYECYIDRCRNNGDITIDVPSDGGDGNGSLAAGGMAGLVRDDVEGTVLALTNCENNGDVYAIGARPRCGGMIGYNDSDGTDFDWDHWFLSPYVNNCINNGDIEAYGSEWNESAACAAGIIGLCYDNDTSVALCVNTGKVAVYGDCWKVPAAIVNYEDELISTSCVSCYWLEEVSETVEGIKPAITCCNRNEEGILYDDGVDCHFFDTISYDVLEAKRNDGTLTTENSHWSPDQWKKTAVPWTGSASYGSDGKTLRLNF